jgi:hypothetical protein
MTPLPSLFSSTRSLEGQPTLSLTSHSRPQVLPDLCSWNPILSDPYGHRVWTNASLREKGAISSDSSSHSLFLGEKKTRQLQETRF